MPVDKKAMTLRDVWEIEQKYPATVGRPTGLGSRVLSRPPDLSDVIAASSGAAALAQALLAAREKVDLEHAEQSIRQAE